MDSFEELDCYRAGRELRKVISKMVRTLPSEEKYLLKNQIIRSSRSVTANIAEGFGRHHHQENLQFCRQSRGSLTETLDHLNVALDEGYIKAVEYRQLREQLETVQRILNGYLNYIRKCAKNGVPPRDSPNVEGS